MWQRLPPDGLRGSGWDALGQLKTVRRRGRTTAGTGVFARRGARSRFFIHDLESRLIAELAANGRVLEGIRLAGAGAGDASGNELRPGLYFSINDHLGTPQRLITGEGTVVWQALPCPLAGPRFNSVRCRTTCVSPASTMTPRPGCTTTGTGITTRRPEGISRQIPSASMADSTSMPMWKMIR